MSESSIRFAGIFPNTLAWRLFVLSALAALVAVGGVGYFISENFRLSAETRLQEILTANIFNLMGSVQLEDTGTLSGSPNLGDARYALFDSGWYWSVEEIEKSGNRLTSASLAGQSIEVPDTLIFDENYQRFFQVVDNAGRALSGLETHIFLGEGNNLFSFKITANKEAFENEISDFRKTLLATLVVFSLSLVFAMSLLVRLGLAPLRQVAKRLGDIQKGEANRIEGRYPYEIQPLIDETNALINSNATIIERARTQVGNLAHSLKTPIAVIQNEITRLPTNKRKVLEEQTGLMLQQVQLYLDRARIAARNSTVTSQTVIYPLAIKLVSVIEKLNPQITVVAELKNLKGLYFPGEMHDVQEIIGNLLENATKYAHSTVEINAFVEDGNIILSIDDDGHGMSDKEINLAMRRGARFDEGKAGWGLGLSIVGDVVEEYNGTFALSHSRLGGLRAVVTLPAKKQVGNPNF